MTRRPLTRRDALRMTATLAAGPFVAGTLSACRSSASGALTERTAGPIAPLMDVSADRVIRVVTGLRPYRPSGFVVRPEAIGDTLVVHNYGHGGGGVTLSWGSAELATEHVLRDGREGDIAVLGCSVIGLTTAIRLLEEGRTVTIYARDLPPHTTSNAAGASFYPSDVVAESGLTGPFIERVSRVARISHRRFQELVGSEYGVGWRPQYYLADGAEPDPWPMTAFPELFPASRYLPPGEHPYGARHVYADHTLLIEVPVYLRALVQDVERLGGRIVVRSFAGPPDVLDLPESLLVNGTGLGARGLFGDDELVPSKSQLVVLLPQPEVDYALAFGEYWMLPRRDGLLLGGAPRGWLDVLEPDPADTARILAAHADMVAALRPGRP